MNEKQVYDDLVNVIRPPKNSYQYIYELDFMLAHLIIAFGKN